MSTGNKRPDATDRSAADQPTIGQIRAEELQGIVNFIDGMFGGPPTGSRVGNGFAFTPEQLDNLAARATEQIHQLDANVLQIRPFGHKDLRPAPDQEGSGVQATAVAKSFADLEGRMTSQKLYLGKWLAALNGAKQKYLAQEHLTEDQWHQLAKGIQA
jgi:hypothetical protein